MRLILSFLFSFIILFAAAQDKPVQFFYSLQPGPDSAATLTIKAKMAPGFRLFPLLVRKQDVYSELALDTTYNTRQSGPVKESGKLQQAFDSSLNAQVHFYTDSAVFFVPVSANGKTDGAAGVFNYMGHLGNEFISGSDTFDVQLSEAPPLVNTSEEKKKEEDSLATTFFIALAAGLLAVVTPCVFPLIPVTVSFFLKRSKTRAEGVRSAFWYSLSIILIYVIPTLAITLLFGEKALYNLSTSAGFNLFFFAMFILFAFSLFGAFELQLPNSWANKADEKASRGGYIGIFFMALTLVIVSFSCTGPIVGTLLGETSNQGIGVAPVIGMLGFSLGLAMPFAIFALFPSMLKGLPKSGGWLNTVKVTFGFIELALALKFLSNVDLQYHWRLLDRDVFLVIWIVLATLMGLYLLGKLKFSHDSDLPYISIPRLLFAITSFSFALYMVPGLWGAPLKALSGIIPPATTQEYDLNRLLHQTYHGPAASTTNSNSAAKAPQKLTDILHVPYGLTAYFDLEEGMAAARALNKPVMLDFTGHSCANCRKMEEYVWSNPDVLKRLRDDFVLISLYVDEPRKLAKEEQYTNAKGEKIRTVGDRNLDYEVTKFGFNAQPLYMFLDLQGEPLSNVKYGYDADINKFIAHLDSVKEVFRKRMAAK